MKKIIVFILTVALAVPASAVAPKWNYKPVKLPEIKFTIRIPHKVFVDWFADHPISFTDPGGKAFVLAVTDSGSVTTTKVQSE